MHTQLHVECETEGMVIKRPAKKSFEKYSLRQTSPKPGLFCGDAVVMKHVSVLFHILLQQYADGKNHFLMHAPRPHTDFTSLPSPDSLFSNAIQTYSFKAFSVSQKLSQLIPSR